MSSINVYVFHPDNGEVDNEISETVYSLLGKFHDEESENEFWWNCTEKLLRYYQESSEKNNESFIQYLLRDNFVQKTHSDFLNTDPSSDKEYVSTTYSGFFMLDPEGKQVESVWQCLNAEGRIDFAYHGHDDYQNPIPTIDGLQLQSCLLSRVDRDKIEIPDAYVYAGHWVAERWFDPITGENQCVRQMIHGEIDWQQHFRDFLKTLSPNTRITAVLCKN